MKSPISKKPEVQILGSNERLNYLSDGVIAIAVTLLILPLVEVAKELQVTSLANLLGQAGQDIFVFLLSFIVICRFWLVHYRNFKHVKYFDAKLFWLNALWLLSIVFLPFPTQLLGHYDGQGIVVTFYLITILITAVFGVLTKHYIERRQELQDGALVSRSSLADYITIAVLALTAFASLIFADQAQWTLLLLLLLSATEWIEAVIGKYKKQ